MEYEEPGRRGGGGSLTGPVTGERPVPGYGALRLTDSTCASS